MIKHKIVWYYWLKPGEHGGARRMATPKRLNSHDLNSRNSLVITQEVTTTKKQNKQKKKQKKKIKKEKFRFVSFKKETQRKKRSEAKRTFFKIISLNEAKRNFFKDYFS